MQYDKALFETMPIPKAVAKNSIPAIMSMLLVFVYNVADTFFIDKQVMNYKLRRYVVNANIYITNRCRCIIRCW